MVMALNESSALIDGFRARAHAISSEDPLKGASMSEMDGEVVAADR